MPEILTTRGGTLTIKEDTHGEGRKQAERDQKETGKDDG